MKIEEKYKHKMSQLSKLNQSQLKSATAPFGHNLIIASAGTGKTSTIVGRIEHLISQGTDPKKILLLTFTNKASQEMVTRVAKIFSIDIAQKIQAGTFHAVAYRWLKKYFPKLTLKQISDIRTLFRSVYEKRDLGRILGESEKVEFYSSKHLYELFSFYQNVEVEKSFSEWLEDKKPEHRNFFDIYEDITDEFLELKRKYNLMDFNDLLINMKNHLRENILEFDEVLIDEYQDTNTLQDSLIAEIKYKSLFCVGDYDQSIYAFNGANINIIGNFSKKYQNSQVFTLAENYRSSRNILELANRSIKFNERIYPKELKVTRTGYFKEPELLEFDTLIEQYEGIAEKIKNTKTDLDEIAILFRNNSSADGIETSLRPYGIPLKRRSGRSFFEAKEIKAIFDIYTFLINPKDMMSFIHVFEYAQGVGVATAQEVFEALEILGNGNAKNGLLNPNKEIANPFKVGRSNRQLALSDYFFELSSATRFENLGFKKEFLLNQVLKHPKLTENGAIFLSEILELVTQFDDRRTPKHEILKIISSKIYQEILQILIKERSRLKNGTFDKNRQKTASEKINEKLGHLIRIAEPYHEHYRFLNAMVLANKDLTQGSGVNLLTVHGSKGLEFKEVYIVDLNEDRFPNHRLSKNVGGIEEERRLFYVAVTRAKDILYLSNAKYDTVKNKTLKPSIFLYESEIKKKDENYFSLKIKSEQKD
jgi:DNA helicase-2/ATP-dependent DNA helicase PcrA